MSIQQIHLPPKKDSEVSYGWTNINTPTFFNFHKFPDLLA